MTKNQHLQLRKLTLLALLTALAVTLRIFKVIPIPNVQPVTDIVMICTLEIGSGYGIILAALTMIISNIYLGFGIWTIPQILAYLGCVLVVILFAKLTPLKKHFLLQLVLATLLGYVYGIIINFGMSIWGGWQAFFGYVATSFLFDTYHCIGNFAFYLVLYKPLTLALRHYLKQAEIE